MTSPFMHAATAVRLSLMLDSQQVAGLEPPAIYPVAQIRGRSEYKRSAPAKERAITRRQQRQVKASMLGLGR